MENEPLSPRHVVVDASKSTLTLKTIAACLIVMVPILVYGTSKYDGFLTEQKQTNQGLADLIAGQTATNAKLDRLDVQISSDEGKLAEHELQLNRIQNTLDDQGFNADASSRRQKRFDDAQPTQPDPLPNR
jgi:hypothetical protein